MVNTTTVLAFKDFERVDEFAILRHPDNEALRACDAAYRDFYKKRIIQPTSMLVGFETYWNLCFDLGKRDGLDIEFARFQPPHIGEFRGATLIVDEHLVWGVRCFPNYDRLTPQYPADHIRKYPT